MCVEPVAANSKRRSSSLPTPLTPRFFLFFPAAQASTHRRTYSRTHPNARYRMRRHPRSILGSRGAIQERYVHLLAFRLYTHPYICSTHSRPMIISHRTRGGSEKKKKAVSPKYGQIPKTKLLFFRNCISPYEIER